MSLQIHTPSAPRHLKITPTMVDDFLIDPVMGAYVLMGIELDVFQMERLRTYWWVPDVIDSSGFGTGKSFVFWIWCQLRCMLIGGQIGCAYYQTFEAGKQIFWPYYRSIRHPLFRAQLGKLDEQGDTEGKDNTRGPACYIQHFRNESQQIMPAPNWLQEAKGQAGLTLNFVGIDEWTKAETMSKKTSRVTNDQGSVVSGINQQILGRVRGASFNQYHPLWGNHRKFMATAESTLHQGFQRVRSFEREIAKGNPNYALFTSCFKDFSNRKSRSGKPFRDEIPNYQTISTMKAQFTRAHYLREVLGVWARETKGWYTEEDLDKCVAAGVAMATQPEIRRNIVQEVADRLMGVKHLHYFMGVDPAPAQGKRSDDGALAILRARPRPGLPGEPTSNLSDWLVEFVWAYRVRKASARQWSGLIHTKHRSFNLSGICMDPNGGGQWIMPELDKSRQLLRGIETECVPICPMSHSSTGNRYPILTLFQRGDPGIEQIWPLLMGDDNMVDSMHVAFQEATEHASVAFPQAFNERPREVTESWPEEQKWALKNLDAARVQLSNIQVATRDDGAWMLTRHNARQFSAIGKKDIAYACIYAYVRFLIWLKMGELEFSNNEGDDGGFYVMNN